MNRVAGRIFPVLDLLLVSGRNSQLSSHCRNPRHVTKYITSPLVRCASSTHPPPAPLSPLRDEELPLSDEVTGKPAPSPAVTGVIGSETRAAKSSEFTSLVEDAGQFLSKVESVRETTTTESTYTSSDITVTGRDAPKPLMRFDEIKWPEEVARIIQKQGFKAPTAIQSQGLPIALEGRDMVGIAQTGSGKTLSYILPAIVRIESSPPQKAPFALVLGPTRELVQQIQSVAEKFPSLRSVVLYGGSAKGFQISDLRRDPKMLIATPGRLIDLMDTGHVTVDRVKYLVLDEADRMLDMGFEPQIRKIIERIPHQGRQTLMWSATWPDDVRELAQDFLTDYIQVNVGSTELHANHNIKQHVAVMHDEDKSSALLDVLKQSGSGEGQKVLIFAGTKRRVDAIVSGLRRRGFRVEGTHGDKSQAQRESILRAFRGDRLDILVATDVAARGLDVDDIKVVINYDFPNTGEDYVHRIGRTARRENKGSSYTFMTHDNIAVAPDLVEILNEANQEVPQDLQKLADAARSQKRGKKAFRSPYERPASFYGSGGRGGGGYGQRDSRFVNRHNASQHEDMDYARRGGEGYNYQRYNRVPSSFEEEEDFPDGGNDRGYRSVSSRGDGDDQSQFGGGRRGGFRSGGSDNYNTRSGDGYGRSPGRRNRGQEDDDGTYGHSDDYPSRKQPY